MKINFDQLFGLSNQESKFTTNKTTYISQASTAYDLEVLTKSLPENKYQSFSPKKQTKNFDRLLKTDKLKDIKKSLQADKTLEGDFSWYKKSTFDNEQLDKIHEQKKVMKSSKYLSKKQEQELTTRLNKPIVKSIKNSMMNLSTQNLRNFGQQTYQSPNKINNHKKHKRNLTESNISSFGMMNQTSPHERLYLQHITKQFNNHELAKEYQKKREENNKRKMITQNSKYSSNYVKFYDRLQGQIQRRTKKQHFYDQKAIVNGKVLKFQPNVKSSKRSIFMTKGGPSIKPRQQKNKLKGRGDMQNDFQRLTSSLQKSFDSVLNRSIEIVQENEQMFINKIVGLFEDDGYCVVTPEAIQQLHSVQFEILFPLIQKMQKKERCQIEVFEAMLRKHMEKLPNIDKQCLRNCERECKKDNRLKLKQTITINSSSSLASSRIRSTKFKSNIKTDYLNKLQQFV